jgi:hypothetical protein
MTKEISIGHIDLIRMGTTYISKFQKKRENVVVVAMETINVARGTCSLLLKKIQKLHFQVAFSKTIFGFETLHVDRTQQFIHLDLFIELFETLKLYFLF